eukprot:SAG11_NODE_3068_length_2714_cov_2.678011_2_plen_171_part_00
MTAGAVSPMTLSCLRVPAEELTPSCGARTGQATSESRVVADAVGELRHRAGHDGHLTVLLRKAEARRFLLATPTTLLQDGEAEDGGRAGAKVARDQVERRLHISDGRGSCQGAQKCHNRSHHRLECVEPCVEPCPWLRSLARDRSHPRRAAACARRGAMAHAMPGLNARD